MSKYELKADDVLVAVTDRMPSQSFIDGAAIKATKRGWNGTALELHIDCEFSDYVYPSEEALA